MTVVTLFKKKEILKFYDKFQRRRRRLKNGFIIIFIYIIEKLI